jgi:S-DNA-T family DNA segregation ATPase FtsK/SpoIIIE
LAAFPPPDSLFGPEEAAETTEMPFIEEKAELIVETLQNFGIRSSVAHIVTGPSVVQFQLELAPGIKLSKVSGLANDLMMALAVLSVRVEAPIMGRRYVGVEIPNPNRQNVSLRSILQSAEFKDSNFTLPLPMGVMVGAGRLVRGLEEMPHLLVAGTTGSGKSAFMNTCIIGMCSRRTPEELRLILVDPKHVEFAVYDGLPHLLMAPISDPKQAVAALTWVVSEMEARSEVFAAAKARSLASYNAKVPRSEQRPNLVVVVDELADLMYMSGHEVEGLIVRLAQKARATGIYLMLATQRPSVDVITGLIKANIPARAAFAVPSQTDSRTILDMAGADKLLGKGDMLFYDSNTPRPIRLQASFVTEERTLEFVEHMRRIFGEPDYIGADAGDADTDEGADSDEDAGRSGRMRGFYIYNDSKLEDAVRVIMKTGIASASGLQRDLRVGYPRAGRILYALERIGVVGPSEASRPREILLDEESAIDALRRVKGGKT